MVLNMDTRNMQMNTLGSDNYPQIWMDTYASTLMPSLPRSPMCVYTHFLIGIFFFYFFLERTWAKESQVYDFILFEIYSNLHFFSNKLFMFFIWQNTITYNILYVELKYFGSYLNSSVGNGHENGLKWP